MPILWFLTKNCRSLVMSHNASATFEARWVSSSKCSPCSCARRAMKLRRCACVRFLPAATKRWQQRGAVRRGVSAGGPHFGRYTPPRPTAEQSAQFAATSTAPSPARSPHRTPLATHRPDSQFVQLPNDALGARGHGELLLHIVHRRALRAGQDGTGQGDTTQQVVSARRSPRQETSRSHPSEKTMTHGGWARRRGRGRHGRGLSTGGPAKC